MFINIIILLASLALILYGANRLTEGGSALAKRFGLSEMVIGLTIVAFGTSAPELIISLMSAIQGSSELAIGNVVGSNIANILLIIGLTALVKPIHIKPSVMANEIPLVILASVGLLACGNSMLLDGMPNVVTRVDGIFLLLLFAVFMRYTFSQAKKSETAAHESDKPEPKPGLWRSLLLIAAGLGALIFGGDLFVDSASGLASELGVSDAIIGLTIVALGTSLPELATSVVAARKGHPDLAVGNVIGSCVFNILCILGLSALITPLPFGAIGNLDLLTMTGAAILFYIAGWLIQHRTITRLEGAIFLALYIAYTAALIL